MRQEFRRYRRYGRRTVAGWSRGGYRSRKYSSSVSPSFKRGAIRKTADIASSISFSHVQSESSPLSSSRSYATRSSFHGVGYGSTGTDNFFFAIAVVLGVILLLNLVVFLA
jgi:hypothetical protein